MLRLWSKNPSDLYIYMFNLAFLFISPFGGQILARLHSFQVFSVLPARVELMSPLHHCPSVLLIAAHQNPCLRQQSPMFSTSGFQCQSGLKWGITVCMDSARQLPALAKPCWSTAPWHLAGDVWHDVQWLSFLASEWLADATSRCDPKTEIWSWGKCQGLQLCQKNK